MCIRLIEDTKESNDISHKLQMHKSLIEISGLYAVPCLIAALLQVLTFGPYNQHFLAAAIKKSGQWQAFLLVLAFLKIWYEAVSSYVYRKSTVGFFNYRNITNISPFYDSGIFYDSYIITMLTNISMSDRPNYIKVVSILFL